MIGGLIMGLVARVVLTILGGSRLEGFALISVIGVENPEFTIGFFISFIGLRTMSIPANVFVASSSVVDPLIHNIKRDMIAKGLGHLMVKQMAFWQAISCFVILGGALFASIMTSDDAMFLIMFSLPAIVIVQIGFVSVRLSEVRGGETEKRKWLVRYGIGLLSFTALAMVMITTSGGYGMLLAISIIFLNPKDILGGKIPPQMTCYEFGESSLPFSFDGVPLRAAMVGMVSALPIGCPTSLVMSLFHHEEVSTDREVLMEQITAGAFSEMMSLLLWMYFGFARSSFADALGKSGVVLDQGSLFSFALAITILTVMSLFFIEKWSYIYLSFMRLGGNLIELLVMGAVVALCFHMTGLVIMSVCLVMLAIIWLLDLRYGFLQESKLSMLGVIPLLSINWLSFL